MDYFKYMPFERFQSLRQGLIRFTQPGAFNDPFEMPLIVAAQAAAKRHSLLGDLGPLGNLGPLLGDLGPTSDLSDQGSLLGALTAQTRSILNGLMRGQIPAAAMVPPLYYPPRDEREADPSPPSEKAIEETKRIDDEIGILSLSMTANNLLLWAHYASEHRGLAVEIDPDDEEFNRHPSDDRKFEQEQSVTYLTERPQ